MAFATKKAEEVKHVVLFLKGAGSADNLVTSGYTARSLSGWSAAGNVQKAQREVCLRYAVHGVTET